jgi:SAM-dependent methyltransferase
MLRALDLFCGAGGATRGLQQAGYHVTGVDIRSMPRYCGERFVQDDAMAWLRGEREPLDSFDLVWAHLIMPKLCYNNSGIRYHKAETAMKITPELAREMYAFYQSGKTLEETAARFGHPYGTVRYAFAREGLSIRQRGTRVKPVIAQAIDDSAILESRRDWNDLESTVKGTIAEGYVKNRLSELGFDVWLPATQNHKTDLLIVQGQQIIRIQVKAATYDKDRKRYRVSLSRHRRNRDYATYSNGDVDFFIVYCGGLPQLEFYVIPTALIQGQPSINLLPHRPKMLHQSEFTWEDYRNAFHLIRGFHHETS